MTQTAESIVRASESGAPAFAASGTVHSVGARGPAASSLSVHENLAAIEQDWRHFEQTADCTPFQTFDWLATWQRHVGTLEGTTPAIVIARRGGEIVCLLPLAVHQRGLIRSLTFLGEDICDYNAPLLAPDFATRVPEGFAALWHDIRMLLQSTPNLRHDTIRLAKMPARIGAQSNPMLALDVRLNPSGAYETALGPEWEAFYASKRSAATRRRDRTKLKRLSNLGEVKFIDPDSSAELALTLDALIQQKSRAFVRMGVSNLFMRPGYAAYFRELATAPRFRSLVHISRLDVGPVWAAINLGLRFRGCYFHILASYDDGETSRFGPGVAHLRELLRHAIGHGHTRFDFTIGDEPYKRDWCDTEQQLFDYTAAASWRGWPATAFSTGWGRVKRAIKKTAPLWNAVVRLRAAVGRFRRQPEA